MKSKGWVVRMTGAGTLALLLAAPIFAQTRDRDWRRNDSNSSRSYRDNERVTLEGRVTSMTRERDGYRVRLANNNHSFWVPQSYLGSNRSRFNVGVSIRLGGVFRGGEIYVDAVNWPGDRGYSDYDRGTMRGVIDRVDYRRATALLRDDASGRLIVVDLRNNDRYSRIDSRDLRRGDYVTLSGDWLRGNVFAVNRIESVRTGRY